MKKFFAEFKEFISRGSVMDLAVGMIIGSAFTAIVNSLVNDVLMPFISLLTGGVSFDQWNFAMGAGEHAATIKFGSFISAVVTFLIVAIVIFLLVKSLNKLQHLTKKEAEEDPKPTTKICPFCKSEISIEATRCPNCTSMLEIEDSEQADA
jgi:large conductance mechanosensitive channel